MTTRSSQLSDDDRRARALAAVIVNDMTLLNEHDGDLPELAARQAAVVGGLRRDIAKRSHSWASALAAGLRRLACIPHPRRGAVDTTQL